MKSGNSLILFLCVAILLSLAGCAQQGSFPTETVEDIFNPTAATEPEISESMADTESALRTRVSLTGMEVKYQGEREQDEIGYYSEYTGADMTLPLSMSMNGNILEYGIGFYLFLDGHPQPYKLSEDGDYSYMHIIYPTDGEQFTIQFIFPPVTGEPGEMLWLAVCAVTYPDYYPTNPDNTTTFHCGALANYMPVYRILIQAEPPELELPELEDHMISAQITYVDVTDAEIGDWTPEELQGNMEYKVYVNDRKIRYLGEYDPPDGLVDIRVEVWGTPRGRYGLAFAINSQLATTNEEEYIFFDIQQGKKTVIEVTLELTDYAERDFHNLISVMLLARYLDPYTMHGSCNSQAYEPIHIQKAKY